MNPRSERLASVIAFYETLDRAALARLGAVYAKDARFKDPFNDVAGVDAIRRIFERMFNDVGAPRFVVLASVEQGDAAFLTWEFRFRTPRIGGGTGQTIRGASHLVFAPDGRVASHRDYWDAAEELYEKLPWVGGLMRWLKRRAG